MVYSKAFSSFRIYGELRRTGGITYSAYCSYSSNGGEFSVSVGLH